MCNTTAKGSVQCLLFVVTRGPMDTKSRSHISQQMAEIRSSLSPLDSTAEQLLSRTSPILAPWANDCQNAGSSYQLASLVVKFTVAILWSTEKNIHILFVPWF